MERKMDMVKEIVQPTKYQCEGCDTIYTERARATKCEGKGPPEFKYNIGDIVETVVRIDGGGELAEVEITDRLADRHRPFYVFEHPQKEGEYWRYPESAFELSDDLKKSASSSGHEYMRYLWREFLQFLQQGKRPMAKIDRPQIVTRQMFTRLQG